MSAYPFRSHARVAVVETVANIDAPTVAELDAGVDITCDLLSSGLAPKVREITDQHQPWHGDQAMEWPVWHGMSWSLTGHRARQGEVESLWSACATFRAERVLVVRYGLLYSVPWAAGQSVMVTRGRWGRRSMVSSGDTAVSFSVVLHGTASSDAAVVAS